MEKAENDSKNSMEVTPKEEETGTVCSEETSTTKQAKLAK